MKNPFLENFRSYIPATVTHLRELTPFPLIVGTLLGMIFGASSLYLVLKAGLTVSASIPVAVISITLFRVLSKFGMKDATILEHNIVQTTGSAGESIAFGIGVTMPAILILGFDLEIWRVTMVAVLGGLIGILMMIPLRRALIRDQHGILKYPEGTACAQVLIAGASKESSDASIRSEEMQADDAAMQGGKIITIGFIMGILFNTLMQVMKAWKDVPTKIFGKPYEGGSVSLANDPALLGVGYIIGPRIAGIMFGGGVLSYMVIIPLIKYFGSGLTEPLAPATLPISAMGIEGKNSIQGDYVLYIGAGAVAAGGIISLIRSLPVIWHGIKGGISDLRGSSDGNDTALPRTDQDLSIKFVIGGILALIVVITFLPALKMNLLGAILIILFGFLFVTVSSRLTGEIGSSSNPISGMTVATLLLTCLVFWLVGWTNPDPYFVTALSVGGIVCIAASNGGTTSQDLKTGFWVGSTPKKQQIAILIGALASALVLGPILIALNQNSTVYAGPRTFSHVRQDVTVPAQDLTPYTGEEQPPVAGDYRVFQNTVAEGSSDPVVSSLVTGSYLVDRNGKAVYKIDDNFPKDAKIPDGANVGPNEQIVGPQAAADQNTYRGWHNTEVTNGIPPGKYLVDTSGTIRYLVDPGVNGAVLERPDGSSVTKYAAPKATLMSYIIKGILSQQLPWGLVLIGVMIAIVLELAGIPSLAFAVGIYLPISISAPIFVGGFVRWAVDKELFKKLRGRDLTEEEMIAETDKSPGVLLASGYIAGGALASIIVAFSSQFLDSYVKGFDAWSAAHNPLMTSDALALLPILALSVVLYLVGREILWGKRAKE